LLSLCTISSKILLQSLWTYKLGWDEPVPTDIKCTWLNIAESIKNISNLKISRHVLTDTSTINELHCFCDASENAYGACIFIKSINSEGVVQVNLLCAKARVAPLKTTTIPRLELCAAVLGTQLSSAATRALRCEISRHFF
jgi:hypothetical protein